MINYELDNSSFLTSTSTKPTSGDWELDDAVLRSKNFPDTYIIPPIGKRKRLGVGDVVKVVFSDIYNRRPNERMWLKITKRKGKTFIGSLDNDPVVYSELAHGDVITFQGKHIVDYCVGKKTWLQIQGL